MQFFTCILLGFLVVCAISVSLSKNLLNSLLIYMSYSLVMSIIWILLESPDLAITEAAVGAGVTSILFFVTLKKIHAIADEDGDEAEAGEPLAEADEAEAEAGEPFATGAVDASENTLADADANRERNLNFDSRSTEEEKAAKNKKSGRRRKE